MEKMMRRTVAKSMPNKMARERCAAGSPAAAKPIRTALSPDSTTLANMIWPKVARLKFSRMVEKSMIALRVNKPEATHKNYASLWPTPATRIVTG